MSDRDFSESVVEQAALAWLEGLGCGILHGPAIAAGEPAAERSDPNYRDVVLERRLRQALVRLNPDLPAEALEDAFRKLTRADAPLLVERNRTVHHLLVDGVTVEYRRSDGSIAGAQARGDPSRGAPGGARRGVRPPPLPRSRALLHRLRGRGRRETGQEARRVSPVPRRERRRRGDAARRPGDPPRGGRPGSLRGG